MLFLTGRVPEAALVILDKGLVAYQHDQGHCASSVLTMLAVLEKQKAHRVRSAYLDNFNSPRPSSSFAYSTTFAFFSLPTHWSGACFCLVCLECAASSHIDDGALLRLSQ